jgi:serine/threonine protein kinase
MGPIKWMSPECLKKLSYSKASDTWSFGILVWEIITRQRPHEDLELIDAAIQIRQGLHPAIPETAPEFWKQLLPKIWSFEPENRPTFEEICEAFP